MFYCLASAIVHNLCQPSGVPRPPPPLSWYKGEGVGAMDLFFGYFKNITSIQVVNEDEQIL